MFCDEELCSTQTLSHSAKGGVVWTEEGIAILDSQRLTLYSVDCDSHSLCRLHAVQLPAGHFAGQQLAASWDGAHIAVVMLVDDGQGRGVAMAA